MHEFVAEFGGQVGLWVFAALGTVALIVVNKFIGNGKVLKYIIRLGNAVEDAVLLVWNTYVDELKQANSDGKLTAEEKAHAKQMAIDAAKGLLGREGLKILTRNLGLRGLDDLLDKKIEASVAKLKLAKQNPPPPA